MLLTAVAGAYAAPFQNGGFEIASINPGAGFIVVGPGSTAIPGWEISGQSIDYIGICGSLPTEIAASR